ncbi:hypothetical protein TWF281_004807 [Arthrobotrys megalospora]
MRVSLVLGIYFPVFALAMTTNFPDLRFNTLTAFLDDLYTLRTYIQTQATREDLTDSYVQRLIAEAEELKALSEVSGEGAASPPIGLASKAKKYFDFVKNLLKDDQPDLSDNLKLIEENGRYGVGDTQAILDNIAEERKRAEEERQAAEDRLKKAEEDYNLFATPNENIDLIDEDEFQTAISDPGFEIPTRVSNDRVAGGGIRGIGGMDWPETGPRRRLQDLDDYEEEKKYDPTLGGVRRNLLGTFEERMNQDSSESDDNPLWYQNFLGPDDGWLDPDAPAGV